MTKYYIYGRYYYYNANHDGPVTDIDVYGGRNRLEFDSKQAAEKYVKEVLGADENYKGNFWQQSGTYVTSWGEYSRPDYQIRKVRT